MSSTIRIFEKLERSQIQLRDSFQTVVQTYNSFLIASNQFNESHQVFIDNSNDIITNISDLLLFKQRKLLSILQHSKRKAIKYQKIIEKLHKKLLQPN
jgi:hypothetical protein